MYDDDQEEDGVVPYEVDNKLVQEKEKEVILKQLQEALNKGNDKESQNEVINLVNQHRRLLLDIATVSYLNKPGNAKLLDSINTILSQIEKSVRDDRKEKMKDKELEDNKVSFANFVSALSEITAGKISMPNYGSEGLPFNVDFKLMEGEDDPDMEIKDEELSQGRQVIDTKEVEASFDLEDIAPKLNLTDPAEDDGSEFDPNM